MREKLNIPYIAERFLGVTIPDSGVMYTCSYEGLHKLVLDSSVSIETEAEGCEDYELLRSKGEALGIFGGNPILEDTQTKISYSFDPRSDTQRIEIVQGEKRDVIAFATMSGDWFFASLSKCGRFLVLAEPYEIEVYRIA